MIKLDYQTNNRRWGWSGMEYSTWENYAFALGFLANINHYRNGNGNLIEVHVELNDLQGADAKEGRIQYYGTIDYLQNNLPDWNRCRSAGNGSITCRINSNGYIDSLIQDYGFVVRTYAGYTTADIFPPANAYNDVWNRLNAYLQRVNGINIANIQQVYDEGWQL